MTTVHKFSDAIETAIKWIIVFAMAVMSIVTIIEVTRRYVYSLSFPWAEELVRYLLIWLSFLGGSVAWKRKGLVFFNYFQDKLAEKGGRSGPLLNLVVILIVLFFNAFIAYLSYQYTFSPVITKQISTGLGISMAYAYVAIPLGFLLICFFTLEQMPEIVRDCIHGKEASPQP